MRLTRNFQNGVTRLEGRQRTRSGLAIKLMVLTLLFAAAGPAAQAQLQRVGPVDALHYGFPAWYQDKTGMTFDLCTPGNQAELDGGWCVILPADVPNGTAPETFPTNFADEHFYWLATTGTNPTGLLVLAVEAGFAGGGPLPGDQIVFGRLRIRINAIPVSGDYKVYTPFGVFDFPGQVQGERLFFTSDIGIACPPGNFDCALNSNIGPFLLPSNTVGGPELPATTFAGTGRKYVAVPGRVGPLTGSTLPPFVSAVDGQTYNHNRFRMEGFDPATGQHFLVTDQTAFSMFGRIMEDTIPGLVSVKRASYSHTATTPHKLDVFAAGFPTTPGRLPTQAPPAPINPNLSFYDAPCATDPVTGAITGPPQGVLGLQMFNHGTDWWGGNAPVVIPPQVCVRDAVTSALFLSDVTDEVDITVRNWDPTLAGGTLTVEATSSDKVTAPTLNVAGFGPIDPLTNRLSVPNVTAPPAAVTVVSLRGGVAALDVRIGLAPGTPVANDDSGTMNEDCSALPALTCATPPAFDVLANDTVNGAAIPPGASVAISTPPLAGTATVNPDNTIRYTPNPNANGTGVVGYTVTANGLTSNQAFLTITINPVNDNPVANNDTAVAFNNVPVTINALTNDTDPDGQAQLANAVIASLPGAGATLTCNGGVAASVGTVCAGGVLTFTSTVPGPFTFTYQAQDQALALSAIPATVTVTVASALPPVANAGAAQTAGSNRAVQLDGSASSDPNVPAQALAYAWTQTAFGQCTAAACPPVTLSNAAGAAPTFTTPVNTRGKSAILTFSLRVTNASLLTSAASLVNVTVNPVVAPVANAGPSQSVLINSAVQLNGSASSDPNGLPITYLWTPGGGVTLSSTTVANPTFTAPANTTQFDISLRVNNGFISSNTSKVTITVN